MIFDSHAHYDDKQFDEERHELLLSMEKNGIGKIVNVGANLESCKSSLELADKYPFMYAALGVHPSDISELNEESFEWLERMLTTHRLQSKSHTEGYAGETAKTSGKVAAVGEIGLDYYWDKEPQVQEQQKIWFRRQLSLARKLKMPVIIHSRDAAADTMEIIRKHISILTEEQGWAKESQRSPGIIHCFSYSVEMAREYVKMGFYIGVGGVVTFKNAKKLKEVVADIPMERIVTETDCPYLAPEPNRGKRNDSRYLHDVVKAIAGLKGLTPAEVEEVSGRNAHEVYQI